MKDKTGSVVSQCWGSGARTLNAPEIVPTPALALPLPLPHSLSPKRPLVHLQTSHESSMPKQSPFTAEYQ
ncbi:hypothetical protein E2C01_048189 [Portunus trituberculatus]|uniref:Uncharacterized protein n=1 Tax=Portunus trituberculatus TaxID=210409 RepID=A0A5B7G9I5_PORTR|nr:hypothetical protein [Portunus trituberculatus]